MSFKIITLSILLAISSVAFAYEEQDNILILHDNDFPQVLQDFPDILIQFYAPWCGHCKTLAPIYIEVAKELQEEGVEVRLAKVDAIVETQVASTYKVRGYPALIYFSKGEKIDFSGQKTKQFMINWLKKRVSDPVTEITKEEFEKLKDDDTDKVCIIFQGDLETDGWKQFEKLASADDYNTYFNVKETEAKGSVVMLRPFGDDISLEKVDDEFKNWVEANDRALVLPFDDRTISSVFYPGLDAICLFNSKNSKDLTNMFKEVAQKFLETETKAKFIEVNKMDKHYGSMINHLKLDPVKHVILILNAKKQEKFIMKGNEPTEESVTDFINSWSEGSEAKVGLTDEIKEVEEVKEEEAKEDEEAGEL